MVIVVLKPDCNLVGQIFYSSFLAASLSFLAYAAFIASVATRSTAEVATASFFLALDFAALIIWVSSVGYTSDVLSRTRHGLAATARRPRVPTDGLAAYSGVQRAAFHAHRDNQGCGADDYPNFEIVVIDNNTTGPRGLRKPVAEYCHGRDPGEVRPRGSVARLQVRSLQFGPAPVHGPTN